MTRYSIHCTPRPELTLYISSSAKLVLSRSTSDALLSSRISLPRVWNSEKERSVLAQLGDINYQCGNCGYRNFSCLDISPSKARVSHRRPQSMFADQNNYVKFSFRVSLSPTSDLQILLIVFIVEQNSMCRMC